ncbi:ATP-dependent RNA helicase HrpA [Larsenimonas suaedae]|uniref:ATP-dependent RNA helicase HrpA n=1 Tax=Larsenimonas suaedae TaxID=1851019 RepID=A0ABU1GXT7_9GAMM|nr:ATP-dependent RNA helicase HrpA [Larsenimonas suaedae]MDR5896866.1 ATP-dependent RNA helicase HrpA [Larsenimonas suaedae]
MRDQLEQCMRQDAVALDRRLGKVRRRIKEGKPSDRALGEIERDIARSRARFEARSSTQIKLNYPEQLPVVEKRADILAALEKSQVVVVAGETGSGKTTQLPKLCLEMGLGRRGLIGHTQPRRLAARSVATRLAEELEVGLGDTVGYQVRFTDTTSESTLVKLMTDGILLNETQHDPWLSRYEAIIIDEAHERSLNIDFLLGYLKRLTDKRPDLKIIITSATIDVQRFSEHFGGAPIVEVSGRTYPVETLYRPLVRETDEEEDQTLQEGISSAVEDIDRIERERGWHFGPRDILIFLPGEREIRETADTLRKARLKDTEVLPLYARLSNSEQNRVFSPHSGRRIVLSTNVAETSLTVPGIRYVIDPGLARISRYSYRAKVQRLPIEAVSQASANQRKGRCGRIAEGVCIRLYSEDDFLARPEFTEPEIQRTNLASVILSMLSLKLGDIDKFPFVDPPGSRFISDGFRLLFELGAVDHAQHLTQKGRQLAKLPIDPRLAAMILAAGPLGSVRETLIIVSALSIQDPRERPAEKREAADQKHRQWQSPDSDFMSWLSLWHGFDEARGLYSSSGLRRWCRENYLNYLRLREWHDTFRQLRKLAQSLGLTLSDADTPADESLVHRALLAGLLSNIGLKQEQREYLGTRNRKFLIHPASGLSKRAPKWVMAGELMETSQLFAREVAGLKPEWIEPLAEHLVKRSYSDPHWEMKRAQVVAFEQVTLFGLPIVSRRKINYAPIAPEEARQIFIQHALVEGEYRTQGAFFDHNRALIDEVGDLEDRARRRDILIDEETLAAFYDQRLPSDVVDGKSFEKWRRHAEQTDPDVLRLDKSDLLARDAVEVTEQRYPDQLTLNGVCYPLSYHFSPGAEDDGVSMTVPASMLSQLPRARLEWLVPGLLRDKAIALMKSLPKQYRRQVVPIPDWVDAALEALSPDDVALSAALAEFMRQKTGLRLPESAWQSDQLPPHLIMNIKVVAHDGSYLGQGRDVNALEQRFSEAAKASTQALANDALQQSALTAWPREALPESHVQEQAGIRVEAYPAVVDEGNALGVKLFDHPDKALTQHREGVKRAAMMALPDQVRYLSRAIDGLEECVLLFANVGSRRDFIDDFVEAAFLRTFAHDPLPRDEAALAARIEAERAELVPTAELIMGEARAALKGHLAVAKKLKGSVNLQLARTYSDLKSQMARLVHRGFIREAGTWLSHYPRYMEAASIRLEKAPREVRKDQLAMDDVQAFEQRLSAQLDKARHQGVVDPALFEFGWWIEELRVSLFAQQLGTLEPVSEKRLERRWKTLKEQGIV